MEKSRWGILAQDGGHSQMITSLHAGTLCEVAAVETCPDRFPLLLADPSIDIMLVSLSAAERFAWVCKAVEAGKHVLCEHQLSLQTEDIEHLISLCGKSGTLAGEASAILCQPRLASLRRHLAEGTFGPLVHIHGCHWCDTVSVWQDLASPLVLAGRYLFGEDPCEVASIIQEARAPGTLLTALLRFPSGGMMSFSCGFPCPAHGDLSVVTRDRRIEVPRLFASTKEAQTVFEVFETSRPASVKTYGFEPSDAYRSLCEQFSVAARKGSAFVGSLDQALANTRVLSALWKAARSRVFERV